MVPPLVICSDNQLTDSPATSGLFYCYLTTLPTAAITGEATWSAMSQDQLKAFLERVKGDANLQDRLRAAKSQDDVVSIAKEHGHDFDAEQISQLGEEELESVTGGTIITLPIFTITIADNV